ncbi:MAG: hypothetical protein N2746_05115 [Deltaproteobacteria bacterium]|nr:hypothetical protein [Deltaproteobacteria bacterium]
MRNIFKIITLDDLSRIEIKNYNKEDKEEIISFLSNQGVCDRVFFWAHKDAEDVLKEFDLLIEQGNNVIVAFCRGRVVGIGISKKFREYHFRHIERFYICIDRSFWGSGLVRELILELVYLSLEDGREKVIIELLPEMKEYRKEIEGLDFEQIALLPEFFMDELGGKRDILVFANNLGNLWKSFEENIDLQFRPHIMED